jgi:hypothetical protein
MCSQNWRSSPAAAIPALLGDLRDQLRAMTDFADGRPASDAGEPVESPPGPAAGPETIRTVTLSVACAGGTRSFRTAGASASAPTPRRVPS